MNDHDRLADKLLEASPDALVAISPDGTVRYWNRSAETIFGYAREEALGRSMLDLIVPPELREETAEEIRKAVTAGFATYESVRRRKDGAPIHMDISQRAVRSADGDVELIVVSLRDVTEMRTLREAARIQGRFSDLLESAPDAMVIVNRVGGIVLVNAHLERLFGYRREELLGKRVELLIPARFHGPHVGHRAGYLADPRFRAMGAGLDLRARRKDGSEFPVEISLGPMRTEEGLLVTAAIRDVTERKAVESQFRGLLEAAPDAMVIVDAEGVIRLINRQTEQLFGYSRDELVGQPVELLVPEAVRATHPGDRARYFADPRVRSMGAGLELQARRRDGTEFPVEISLSPMESQQGLLVTAAIRDITQQRQLRAQLEQQYRQVQEASRLKSEFLANMSHELRTPLNAIIGFSQLMHDGKVGAVSAEQAEFLGDILTSSRHLLRLINDILDLAKVESGNMALRPEPVHLGDLIEEVRSSLASLVGPRGIPVSVEVDPGLGSIVADPTRLKQILYNYLSNALKFTPDAGRVIVRVQPEGPAHFRVEVEDTGIGIAPGDLDRLFVEFQQLDASAAKKYAGTGLGLALTRRIVEAQGGRVGVHSAPGRGSTFFAVLPRLAPERGEPEAAASAGPPGPAPLRAAPTVLVVEDNPTDRSWLIQVLAEAGYGVESAATGTQAVDLAQQRRFDAITLDLLLPDIDGQEVLRRLRAAPYNRETPVIVVSIAAEARHALAFQVQDILAKPVERTALVAALERAGVRPDGRPVLVVDDDPQTLKLAETTLRGLGYRPLCRADGDSALEVAAAQPPAAVVLDLLMPGMTGFEFLERFQRMLSPRIPVIVWTVKDLSREEHARLLGRAHAIVVKSDGPQALLDQLAIHIGTPRPAGTPGSSDAR